MPAIRILYIAYPLLTVSDRSAGGAEQVLWTLEREMARRGVHTTVAASAGSSVTGALFSTGGPCIVPDDYERRNREHQENTVAFIRRRALEGRGFDLVHDMSGSFWASAAAVDVSVLATLHLPRPFYPPELFTNVPENVSFNCVSHSQAESFAGLDGLLGVVPNGIALDRFQSAHHSDPTHNATQRNGLLWLGRICEEKAPHLALEIAERAGLPITLAGQVYPFSYHQQYFEKEIAPRLLRMPQAKLVWAPSFKEKCNLLRQAQALLITSLAHETSSLVAMESAASGTPVIAFRRGALPEVVRDRRTGFLVDDLEAAISACRQIETISNVNCEAYAQENFSSAMMAEGYSGLYAHVLQSRAAARRRA